MTKDTIFILREYFKDLDVQLFINNAILCNTTGQHTTVLWDDTREILHQIRPNNSHYTQDTKRLVVDSTPYDNIQTFTVSTNREETVVLLNKLKADGIATDEVIAKVLASYDELDSKLL